MKQCLSVPAALCVCGLIASAGCYSPAEYRDQADQAAHEILRQAQIETFGQADPIDITPAADTMRKRLLAMQCLPVAAPASRGIEHLDPAGPPGAWPARAIEAPNPSPGGLAVGLDPADADQAVELSMADCLAIAAANSREYQSRKEDVFRAALALDLRRDEFRFTWAGLIETLFQADYSGSSVERNVAYGADGQVTRKLKTGASIAGRLVFDIAQLLTDPGAFSKGLAFDGSVTVPLLAGSGEFVVTEPLTQAQRDVVYALWSFARFRKSFAVEVASSYLGVLQQADEVDNARENYRNLIASAQRARALADAGRLPEIQVDQARQDELRARDRWISARRRLGQSLDSFKITLSLPTDAKIQLKRKELVELAQATREKLPPPQLDPSKPRQDPAGQEGQQPLLPDAPPALDNDLPTADVPGDLEIKVEIQEPTRQGAGPLELEEDKAIRLALANRLDLRTQVLRVEDAQRQIVVAADALRAGLQLTGSATAGGSRGLGSATADDANLRFEKGTYGLALSLDLPWEKTAERNNFRNRIIELHRAIRDVQQLEDHVKFDIRNALRTLASARESYLIQSVALMLARRRVESTTLFLQAGRAEIRDLLEAQESLVNAQNALTAALVNYRITELQLQRDMGLLQVNQKGLWHEYVPEKPE